MDTVFRTLLPAILLVLAGQTAAAATWNFASGGNAYASSGSSYGNQLVFSAGTETLRVTAWADTAGGSRFETAWIQRFSTGLGACNRGEGSISSCINTSVLHQIDNVSQQDLVLFLFESVQVMQSLTIDPWGTWDRDVSFRVGNLSAGTTLSGSTFSNLATLGFGSQVNSFNSASNEALTISLGGYMGNALLVGGLFPADGTPDRFKIRSLTTGSPMNVVPVPASAWLFLSGLGLLTGLRRSRHSRPGAPPAG